MAVNDLITRLILQTKEFDGNLQRSQKEMKNFQKEISAKVGDVSKGFSSTIGVVGKLAPAIGIAAGGVEAFKKTIGATQSTQDTFNRAIEQAKTGVDVFFESVARADFGNFIQTMNDAITAAGNFYDVLDELQTRQIHANSELKGIAAEEQQIRADIATTRLRLAKSSTDDERSIEQAHLKTLEGQLAEYNDNRKIIYENLYNNAYNTFSESLKKELRTQINNDALVLKYIKTTNRDKLKADADYYREREKLSKGTMVRIPGTLELVHEQTDASREALKWLQSEEGQRQKIAYLINENKDDLKESLSFLDQAYDYRKQEASLTEHTAKQELELLNLNKQKVSVQKSHIAIQREQYENIDKLIFKSEELRVKMAKASEAGDTAGIMYWQSEMEKTQVKIDELKKFERDKAKSREGTLSVPTTTSLITPNLEAMNTELQIWSNNIKTASAQTYFFQKLGDSSKGLEDLASGLGDVVNAAGAISDNPAIRALAASLMILQGVQKLASATTWVEYVVGGISVAAAVASMASTFSNMNKFAGGGVVGDQNIVRINSGEMILNHAQQSRLFNTLNSGRTDSDSGGQVQFVIRGQDLVGVQKNHNSKFGKNGSNY